VPSIVIPESIREQILTHAREGAPEEVCGVLSGTENADAHHDETDHRVEVHHPAENVAERPRTRYEIDPREQLELMETIEDAGREVVGFYHSHPEGPAGSSATDSAQATWPGRSYVIVSLGGENGDSGASLGSWRWTGEEFVEESVRVG
jgi:proteasome lid subunit RPN8/RPN11